MDHSKLDQEHCLECGAVLYGRSDKKFCTCSCKNRYYNRQRADDRKARNREIITLTKNYTILDDLLREGRDSIDMLDVLALGFSPYAMTGHRQVRQHHDENCCFNITYCQSNTRIFKIRKFKTNKKPAQ